MESVGKNVKNIQVGDRVVVSAPIACGQCECKLMELAFVSIYLQAIQIVERGCFRCVTLPTTRK